MPTGRVADDDILTSTLVAGRKTVPASFVVYKDGANYYAENLTGGADVTPGTDAATVIQNALNGLTAGRTWKEKVVFKGDIDFTSTSPVLTIPSYSILEIQGRLKFNSNIPVEGAFLRNSDFTNGNSNIEIRGGTIDGTTGTSVTGHGRGHAIEFRKVTDFLIDGITFQKLSGMCLRNGLTNSANTGNSYGTVTRCRVTDGTVSGFVDFLGDSSKISVIGNQINLWDTSITVYDGTQIQIAHNYLAQRAPGVEIIPQIAADICRDITIEDNIIVPSVTKGIWIHQNSIGEAGTVSRIDVLLNKIISPPQVGIELFPFAAMDKIRLLYNTIISPGNQGIFLANNSLASPTLDSQVIGNTIISPVQEAIRLIGIQDSIISDNRIEGSTGAGIHLLRIDATTVSKFNQIKRNIIKNSTGALGYGIFEDTSCDFNEIADNILVGNAQVGIFISGVDTRIHNNQGYNPAGIISNPYPGATGNLLNSSATQAFPGSTAVYTVKQSPKTVIVGGGTISAVAIDGLTTGLTSGVFRLGINQTISVTHSVNPTINQVRAE